MTKQPVSRGPANLTRVQSQDLTKVLNDEVVSLACELNEIDYPSFHRFTRTIAELIAAGSAARKLGLEDILARAKIRDSDFRRHFSPGWEKSAELSIRMLHRPEDPSDLFEVISTRVVETGKDNREALGREYVEGSGNTLRVITTSSGQLDRHLETFLTPLTTGTRHDRTAPHADLTAIREFEEAQGRRIPGGLGEHIRYVLERRQGLIDLVDAARAVSPARFEAVATVQLFAPWMLGAPLIWGPPAPNTRAKKYSDSQLPGTDASIVEAFSCCGVNAVLDAGSDPHPRDPLPERGYDLLEYTDVPLKRATFGIEWWINETENLLARGFSQGADRGAQRRLWRLVNPDRRPIGEAINAIEHYLSGVPSGCLDRHHKACRPGRLSVRAKHEPAVVASIELADAVCVKAERRSYARVRA